MQKIRAITDPELMLKSVQSDDLMVIMRPIKNESGVIIQYETHTISMQDFMNHLSATMLSILGQNMPKSDPADGRSLWLDDRFVRMASGDASKQGMQSQTAFDKNLQVALTNLPTTDPGDGSPWLCGGVVMRGSNNTTKGC